MQPTITGFLSFIRNVMGINATVLPDNAPVINWAFVVATMIVNPNLAIVATAPGMTPETSMYILAVYNLAGDNLVNYAQDQPQQTFFIDLRDALKINNFAAGVVSSASDNGTGDSLMVPDALKGLTLANLQNIKTPWGRTYLGIAQSAGTLWGVA